MATYISYDVQGGGVSSTQSSPPSAVDWSVTPVVPPLCSGLIRNACDQRGPEASNLGVVHIGRIANEVRLSGPVSGDLGLLSDPYLVLGVRQRTVCGTAVPVPEKIGFPGWCVESV